MTENVTDPNTGTLTDIGTGTVYHSSLTTSGDLSNAKVITTIVSTVTMPSLNREKSELFITLQSVENKPEISMAKRDPSKFIYSTKLSYQHA